MRRLQQPALVALENGKPVQVSWPSAVERQAASGGRLKAAPSRRSRGHVTRVIDEWRMAGRWWVSEMRRDYYLVELDGGRLIELYREGERWCVTGIAD